MYLCNKVGGGLHILDYSFTLGGLHILTFLYYFHALFMALMYVSTKCLLMLHKYIFYEF